MNEPVKYLKLADGSTFIPIGLNLAFPRFYETDEEALALYRDWIGNLADNGGNFIRLWVATPFFDVEGDQCGDFRPEKTANLRAVLDFAHERGVKAKLTLDHFRTLQRKTQAENFAGVVRFDRPKYHVANGGFAEEVNDYFATEAGHRHFLAKMDFFAAHFGDHPAIVAWELWNEISAVPKGESRFEWSEKMILEMRKRFPGKWTLQSNGSGSFTTNWCYQWLAALEGNDIIQAHRYLDPAPEQKPVVLGPLDVNMADAVRVVDELCERRKPVLLAEGGAVSANFVAPFPHYPRDKRGSILHDVLFAGFFAGGCGPGQAWHWDHYVAPSNLWWHYRSFARMLEGIDPAAEHFVPHFHETDHTRIYELRGKTTRLFWIRDAQNDWHTELLENQPPVQHPASEWEIPGDDAKSQADWAWLDPWSDAPSWQSVDCTPRTVQLPTWERSLLLRCQLA